MQGPARGYPLWTCFLQLFKRILIQKAAFLNKVYKVFDLLKVCFVFAFEKHAFIIKFHSATIKNSKEEGKTTQLEPKRLFFVANANSNF